MHDMKILLKLEFKRLFKNKMLYVSLFIGIILAAGSFINKVIPHMDILKGFSGNVASYPFSVFNSWIGTDIGFGAYATAYLYVCILLAALPYCAFFSIDNRNQYILQYYSRIDRKKLHAAKFMTTFLSGGLIVLIPILLNLIATMMFVPVLPPIENGLFIGTGKSIMGDIFSDHAFIYIIIYLVQFFIYGGAFSVVSLAVSFLLNNAFLVVLSPFITYYGLGVISRTIQNLFGIYTFNPMIYMSPSILLDDIGLVGFILEPIIITLISGIIFFHKGEMNETL